MPGAESAARRWRGWLRRGLWLGMALLAAWLIWHLLHETDWPAVRRALAARGSGELLLIAALALASHALYGLLDLIGAHSLGLKLPHWRTWLTATASYACNLNLGSLVGAAALRYRLYGRQGVATADVSRLIVLSMASNWLGYLLLIASLPLWAATPALTRWTGGALPWLSLGAALVVAGYLYACAAQLRWRLRGHVFAFPAWPAALAQIGVAALNWALMGLVLQHCLGQGLGYAPVLSALLVAAVAGAVTHVPGGWGVLDFVIVKSLAGGAEQGSLLIAGVLVYRAAYYLLPLALASFSLLRLSFPRRAVRRDASPPARRAGGDAGPA
ncbi:UPF0104 family protein [Tahibacter harae]|uniref:UPF0104 family protein n=1 Tax=Tahibacter harae TaxID=2963937 RepID=A0ABT1QTH2_9GAMM|nr:UPF0104 family protein [Tahibacter harae]MCQ4165592.1 UPF0104 family protein [Tahibacter harae]